MREEPDSGPMNLLDFNDRPALADHVRLKIDPLSGDAVLLYPEGVLILNSTAHDIVKLCDGATNVYEILAALSAQYEVDESTLQADAAECLTDLLRRNLIVLNP